MSRARHRGWKPLLLGSAVLAGAAACSSPPTVPAEAPLGTAHHCAGYDGLPPGWGVAPQAGMRWIAAGTGTLGSTRGYAEERPERPVSVAGFWIDRTEVTNAQFAAFVAATGHVTTAERSGTARFVSPAPDAPDGRWWQLATDTHWRAPDGPGSTLDGRANHPVVHVSLDDARAYAAWLGRDLPTEREWEFAAKAGRDNATADAALHDAQRRPLANIWQGLFPFEDRGEDGHAGRAPVGCYPANPNGLHDMLGNVWEWTLDAWSPHGGPAATPQPPRQVIKGGSYLCAASYCMRARASSRQGQEADLPASHLGFRTVLRS